MKQQTLDKLRSHFHALLNLQRRFEGDEAARYNVDKMSFQLLVSEIKQIEQESPGLLPPFREADFREAARGEAVLAGPTIRSYLAVALGKLRIAVESSEGAPVTEAREFPFVTDAKLRSILERDYQEMQRAFVSQCWKSVIILAGGAIEAILMDLLMQNHKRAKTASNAPKNKPDIGTWVLADLIKVCVELHLVTAGVEKLSDPIREYRNLVHPGNEIRQRLEFGKEEARIAIEVLNIAHRDLSS